MGTQGSDEGLVVLGVFLFKDNAELSFSLSFELLENASLPLSLVKLVQSHRVDFKALRHFAAALKGDSASRAELVNRLDS